MITLGFSIGVAGVRGAGGALAPAHILGVTVTGVTVTGISATIAAGGTLYWALYDLTDPAPDAAAIIAGTGFAAAGSWADLGAGETTGLEMDLSAAEDAEGLGLALVLDGGVYGISQVWIDAGPHEISGSAPGPTIILETDFGSDFQTEEATLWSAMQSGSQNGTATHDPTRDWSLATSEGGVRTVKSAANPSVRFTLTDFLTVGRDYRVTVHCPIGADGVSWNDDLVVRMGVSTSSWPYHDQNYSNTGQPRLETVVEDFEATSTTFVMRVAVSTSSAGTGGGNPAISYIKIEDITP